MSIVHVVAGEDGHTCRRLVPQASTAGNMSGQRCACSMGEAACLHVRARADPDTPLYFGLPEPCFDDRSRAFRPLQDITLLGELPARQRRGELQ